MDEVAVHEPKRALRYHCRGMAFDVNDHLALEDWYSIEMQNDHD